jgi:hypothetical protein
MELLTRASETKVGNKGRCGGAFSMKEILTDYIMKQKYGWSDTMNKVSSSILSFFEFQFFINCTSYLASFKKVLTSYFYVHGCSSALLYELVF